MSEEGLLFPSKVAAEWGVLHRTLVGSRRFQRLCTEPFLGYRPKEYDSSELKILYVGKATSGDPDRTTLEHVYRFNSSAFWTSARELRDSAAQAKSRSVSLAWSNVCKIGVTRGNPNNALIREQASLASKTLTAELFSPGLNLAVFVCEGYADTLVYNSLAVNPIVLDPLKDLETRYFEDREYWRRSAMDGFPPVLWVQHPQGKSKENLRAWTDAAIALLR